MLIEGKIRNLHGRKYCITCSPFNKHNTRPLLLIPDCICALQKGVCKICGNKTKSNRRKICASCSTNFRRFRIKQRMINYKGGKCSICNYSKCMGALEFHHLEPTKKEFDFGGAHCRKWSSLQEELDKCILVCSNCHRELGEEERRKTSARFIYYLNTLK